MVHTRRLLPLFPLNMVLFPGAVVPLHIFEDRYKMMIQMCLDDNSEFGIVLIKSGSEVGAAAEPHHVGTVARIMDVEHVDQGRLRISVIGQKRFQISQITQKLPHIEALVDILDEDDGRTLSEKDMEALRTAAVNHIRLLEGLNGGWMKDPVLPDSLVDLSYFLAIRVRAANEEKQALLEEMHATERLRTEVAIIQRNEEWLRTRVSDEMIRRSNGME